MRVSGISAYRENRRLFQNIPTCVITKDLSRLGRNYLESGAYIEVFFPQHHVPYVAVNDGVDSANSGEMDIAPFKNILNEDDIYDWKQETIIRILRNPLYKGRADGYGGRVQSEKSPQKSGGTGEKTPGMRQQVHSSVRGLIEAAHIGGTVPYAVRPF